MILFFTDLFLFWKFDIKYCFLYRIDWIKKYIIKKKLRTHINWIKNQSVGTSYIKDYNKLIVYQTSNSRFIKLDLFFNI